MSCDWGVGFTSEDGEAHKEVRQLLHPQTFRHVSPTPLDLFRGARPPRVTLQAWPRLFGSRVHGM